MAYRHLDEVRPLNLEQQKKRARELKAALAAGDPAAIRRFRQLHPKSAGLTDAALTTSLAKITEAQLVIARELGLPSWPRLRAHIERLDHARAAVAAGANTIDSSIRTLHIRCGTDIQQSLQHAGLRGEFLQYSDPYCHGPVPDTDDLLNVRARFLSAAHDIPLATITNDLLDAERRLADSVNVPRVVLWFEHDSYDQLILARILAHYAAHGRPRRLELVHADSFPAVSGFHGLGELSPAALRTLWEDRVEVTTDMLALGKRVWDALRQPSPTALMETVRSSDALPAMGRAVRRHLMELPWLQGGLSLTERLALQLIAEGAEAAGAVFQRLTSEREPLVYLGDGMFWSILRDLSSAESPAITLNEADSPETFHRSTVALTNAGRRMLAGELDWRVCGPVERWVGGVRIAVDAPDWRWSEDADAPVLNARAATG